MVLAAAQKQRKTPYQENTGGNRVIGSLAELIGTTPELRFIESDQADPAGQFRTRIATDIWYFERAQTVAWATTRQLLKLEALANRFTLGDVAYATHTLMLNIAAGGVVAITASDDTATLELRGGASTFEPTVEMSSALFKIKTGNSGSSAWLNRLTMSTNVTISIATWSNTHHTGFITDAVGGRGNQDMAISGNDTVTDPTARRITMSVLDPATDTKYIVAQAVPKAATPLFTTLVPNYTPTTSELDASNLTFKYTSGGNLTAYVNDAGSIKALVLGAPA